MGYPENTNRRVGEAGCTRPPCRVAIVRELSAEKTVQPSTRFATWNVEAGFKMMARSGRIYQANHTQVHACKSTEFHSRDATQLTQREI